MHVCKCIHVDSYLGSTMSCLLGRKAMGGRGHVYFQRQYQAQGGRHSCGTYYDTVLDGGYLNPFLLH